MKQQELEQLRKDINARIDEAIKNLKPTEEAIKNLKPTEEDFVKGQWYKLNGAYAKYDLSGWGLGFFSNGGFSNRIGMTDTSLWQPVTDFAPLIELLKAEVIKRIGKGKPIGVRDIEAHEWDGCSYWTKNDSDKLGSMWHYVAETDTLYNKGEYNRTIVYENGVFATVANEESPKHNKEHVTNELIKRGFVKGCSFVSCWGKTHTDSSGIFNFEQFTEGHEWVVFMDRTSVYADGKYATIINPMQDKLEEAKLKYPIGTEFYGSLSKMRFKVCNGIKIGEDIKTNLYGIDSNGNSVGCIYCGSSDTWAEIIPQDKGAVLIEQAKKMYPKGTKYKPVESMFPVNEVTSELRYGYYGNDGIDCDEGGFVYLNGIWATIIEEPYHY